ncbi:MAG: RluA family pseudouridine synthase [Alkalispirochaeta sp.]
MKEETVGPDDNGRRLDRVLRKAYPSVPPGAIAGAVRRGEIRLNGKRTTNDARVAAGDTIRIPDWQDAAPMRTENPAARTAARYAEGRIISGEWSIPVLDRTEDWLAVNKPSGLAAHGPGTLDEMVRTVAQAQGWWADSMSFRPGPVHRLDRNTSGVQLFSLSADGARTLTEHIRRRHVAKVYIALVSGYLPRRTESRKRIAYDRNTRTASTEPERAPAASAGRRLRYSSATTHFFPLAFTADRLVGLVAAVPETGRTHQVRCHAADLGIPLLGDRKYGGARWSSFDDQHDPYNPSRQDPRYILHAALFATTGPERVWTAPFASATYGLLRRHFGDLASVEHRLNEIVPIACTGCAGTVTIRV